MKHTNIEIKARCHQPDVIRQILLKYQADFLGTDHQIDTYFNVSTGRLKLREGTIENYLIHYQRNNQLGPKQADVLLYSTKPEGNLKHVLTAALGILTVVDKQREIYFIDNVKFHIDCVNDLGNFVEIEAIDDNGSHSVEQLQVQCQQYIELLGIQKTELQSESYSDMLLAHV